MRISDFMKSPSDFPFVLGVPRPANTYRAARRNAARKKYREMS